MTKQSVCVGQDVYPGFDFMLKAGPVGEKQESNMIRSVRECRPRHVNSVHLVSPVETQVLCWGDMALANHVLACAWQIGRASCRERV